MTLIKSISMPKRKVLQSMPRGNCKPHFVNSRLETGFWQHFVKPHSYTVSENLVHTTTSYKKIPVLF